MPMPTLASATRKVRRAGRGAPSRRQGLWPGGPAARLSRADHSRPRNESLLLTREELLDILAAELGAFDDRMADARKHLLEPRADLTLADLFGALLDPFGRAVHLGLVSGISGAAEQGQRKEHRSDPEPVAVPHR